ncbi:MAG: hypothetical protein Q8M16_17935 [Pirellulaceae bacterium]|nr:hypothetical protein [Pirellulaceae bacterium]
MFNSICRIVSVAVIAVLTTQTTYIAPEANAQETKPDDPNLIRNGPDRAAKFAEVYNRTFEENLSAVVTEDGGLGSAAAMGMLTPARNVVDLFSPTFNDPRMRRMHENLVMMNEEERRDALARISRIIKSNLDLIQESDAAAFDFPLGHGLRCMLFLLTEFDFEEFDSISPNWLEIRATIATKYRGRFVEAPDGEMVPAGRPFDIIDEVFVFNLYLQKIVRSKGKSEAKKILDALAEQVNAEQYWIFEDRTWTTKGQDERIFSIVIATTGAGRELSRRTERGQQLLDGIRAEALREEP